ncbi:MAG: tRNA uracil 4-sulfurtransferase ThiI [Myxococcota bacterium]|nr:tRNA uracil 4-sulfurtransferase ThiI [Myxococcota bacterium]
MLRLGELWLKGNNQKLFLRRLHRQLLTRLERAVGRISLHSGRGRIFIDVKDASRIAVAASICADTPGITSVSPVLEVGAQLEAIDRATLQLARQCWSGRDIRFAVDARRTDTRFGLSSTELNRRLGSIIQSDLGLTVDLSKPDGIMGLEVDAQKARIWVQVLPGVGGLPVGTAGQVLLLLSGGIDSPVAGFLSQKRGCHLEAVYFHSPPFISDGSREKVLNLAQKLGRRQGGMHVHVVHFTPIQKMIKQHCDQRFSVLLYRRFMYRIADRIATETQAKAICTGENLAQVASQTLENLRAVDEVTTHLTLRPLITYDKDEIVRLARRIGTFDLSVLPFDDCCTLFVPKNPITKSRPEDVAAQEQLLNVELLVADAVDQREIIRVKE